jgi:hypothetical protein
VPASGVPAIVAVPSPLSWKVTVGGSGPASVIAGVGEPVVVMVKLPATPVSNTAVSPLVMAGAVDGTPAHAETDAKNRAPHAHFNAAAARIPLPPWLVRTRVRRAIG